MSGGDEPVVLLKGRISEMKKFRSLLGRAGIEAGLYCPPTEANT